MTGQLSEDGEWMWNGSIWEPVQIEGDSTLSSIPVSNFLTPAADYNNLTAQVDFLGNSSLASDMRSVSVPTNLFIHAFVGVLAILTIFLIVPMVLFLSWLGREQTNFQKRNQMINSAEIYVKSTPVPAEKVQAIPHFQF